MLLNFVIFSSANSKFEMQFWLIRACKGELKRNTVNGAMEDYNERATKKYY